MLIASLVVGTLVLVALVVACAPWRPSLAVEVRGTPDGNWALAGGVELAACSLSFARARSTPTLLAFAILGRTVMRRTFAGSPPPRPEPERSGLEKAAGAYERLERWVDPVDLAIFLVDETGRVRIRDVEGRVELGVADVALAGRVGGALLAFAALVEPFGRLRHRIDWSGREHLDASLSLCLRFSPALLVLDGARFVLKNVRRRRLVATAAPAPGV